MSRLSHVTHSMHAPEAAPQTRSDAELTLTALLEASPLAIVTLDRESRVTSWNPAAERTFGWKAPEILGKPYPLVPGELSGEFQDYVARALTEEVPPTLVTRRKRKDGTLVDVRILAAPLRSGTGHIQALLGFISDVSAERHLESQLRQAAKMEAVGQLAGGVAHDFNNILTVISAHCELLQQDEAFPPAYRGEVAAIAGAAGRAADLTRQLLAFGRKQILKPRRVDLNHVAKGLKPMLVRLLGENIRVGLRLAEVGPVVFADRGQLEQIIINLAVNARDAMPKGGELIVQTRTARIKERDLLVDGTSIPSGTYAALSVRDSGVGMSPATLAHIFEPFFTTKEFGKGTGLGLSTVYGIVKQSGGFVWADSEPGKGTTMNVFLPQLEAEADPITPPGVAAVPRRSSETVLVVEDEASVRVLTERLLRKHGFVILTAGSVGEAMHLADAHQGQIEVLLTDTVLPDGDGPSLARDLLERGRVQTALLMSGYAANDVVRRGLASENMAFVPKPFSSATLVGAIRSAIDSAERVQRGGG